MNMMTSIPGLGATGAPKTLADARRDIQSREEISITRRRNCLSGLSGIERICGMPAAAIELTCPNLRKLLYRKPPAAFGFGPQRFGKLLIALRYAMRGMGLHAPKPSLNGLTAAWRHLFDALPGRQDEVPGYRQIALGAFIGFCCDTGFEPTEVSTESLESFETFLSNSTLVPNPAASVYRTVSNWNWARSRVSAWGGLPELHRPPAREYYTQPLENCPPSFQEDWQGYLDGRTGQNQDEIYHDNVRTRTRKRRRRAPSPRTVQTWRYHLRQAIAGLVLQGVPIEQLHTLRDLVVPIERAALIRRFYRDRHGDGPNSQVCGIIELLRQIACYHCRLPQKDVDLIAGWASEARPDWQAGMTEKNRRRLRALIQLRQRAMLLHLPRELLKRAQSDTLTPKAAARLVSYAVALEIELVFPIRRENLARLRLDEHLQRLGPRGQRITHIFLSAAEMKNRHGMEWELPQETCELIETYLRHYRPHIASPDNMFLFPSQQGGCRTAHELARVLCDLIGSELGVEINIHLLRHFAGWLFLQRNPGQYEVLRQVLGHQKIEVTIACYTGLEADASARHFDENVLQERAATRHVAQAAFRKPTRKARRMAKRGVRK